MTFHLNKIFLTYLALQTQIWTPAEFLSLHPLICSMELQKLIEIHPVCSSKTIVTTTQRILCARKHQRGICKATARLASCSSLFWKPMFLHAGDHAPRPWPCPGPSNTKEYYEILGNTTEYWGILRNTKEYEGILQNTKEYYWILRNAKQYWSMLKNTVEYYGILRNKEC